MQCSRLLIVSLLAGYVVGCAGPTTPFGALALRAGKALSLDFEKAEETQARVRFLPERQVLHAAADFQVILEDPKGIPNDFYLSVSYNGLDVSQEFLANAKRSSSDSANRQVNLTTKSVRFLPSRENKIQVTYRRAKGEKSVIAHYLPPACSVLANNQMLFTIPEFDPPSVVLQLINQQAARKNFNPYFVAALVAQESSFDPRAVSRNKALGLTQVTTLGESEIIKNKSAWPRYPGLDEMSLPFLKLAIMNGRIHSGNEWRLNPALSIEGGVDYLQYLFEYWNRPDKRAQIERKLGPSENVFSEVLLASYNSGAARVGEVLERRGDKWLQDEVLGEAQKYVHRVVSYCDHFEHRE